MADKKYFYANGKRKTSTARIRLYPGGTGQVEINGKPSTEYFSTHTMVSCVTSPLKELSQEKNYDLTIIVKGGGLQSQAEACRHGVARALQTAEPEHRTPLKRKGLLTRDARIKERKKPGLKRARRSPQWSKR